MYNINECAFVCAFISTTAAEEKNVDESFLNTKQQGTFSGKKKCGSKHSSIWPQIDRFRERVRICVLAQLGRQSSSRKDVRMFCVCAYNQEVTRDSDRNFRQNAD